MSKEYTRSGTIRTEGRFSRNYTARRTLRQGGLSLLLFITILLLSSPASGQRKSDLGIMLGVPWYFGDMAPDIPQPLWNPPSFGAMMRYNFNMRNSLRARALFYDLAGSGEIFGSTEADFHASFVDLGLDFEFNWWPYQTASTKTKYSPYVSAGLGYSIDLLGEGKSHLNIPFGGGVKVNLGKRLSGGLEVSVRKTFNDLIDGVTNPGGEAVQTPLGNNDWYMFTGVFLTYKIKSYLNECPTYPEKTYRLNSNSKRNKTENWYQKPHDKESIFEKISKIGRGR